MYPELLQYLQHIGISEKEISVYQYLLAVEKAFPIKIAKETKLKRSTVYVILDLLKEKGLTREITIGKRVAYQAESPDRIKFLLEEKKLKTEEYLKNFDTFLPLLRSRVRNIGEAPVVKFLEGEAAVQISMRELAENPRFRSELDYGVFSLELMYDLFRHKDLRGYIDLRIKDNKKFRAVYSSEEGVLATDDSQDQETLRVDQKEFPISCDISVFEDEVRFHMLGDTIYGVLIKNPELAQTLTSLIRLAMRNNRAKG